MLSRQRVFRARHSFAASYRLQTQFGLTQPPADKNDISRSCTGTQDGVAGSHFADYGYVYEDIVPTSGVSAGKEAAKLTGSAPQPSEEEIQPSSGVRFRQSQTQQEAARYTSHGGDVAECSGEALPSHGIRWMLLSQEVRSFKGPIAGED